MGQVRVALPVTERNRGQAKARSCFASSAGSTAVVGRLPFVEHSASRVVEIDGSCVDRERTRLATVRAAAGCHGRVRSQRLARPGSRTSMRSGSLDAAGTAKPPRTGLPSGHSFAS